jgi:DNA topoisomerase-2
MSKVSKQAPTPSSPSDADQHLANKYRGLSEIEHVLEAPDVHIGTVNVIKESRWVVESTETSTETSTTVDTTDPTKRERMVRRELPFIPALLKLFDEAIVNSRDQSVRISAQIAKELSDAEVTFGRNANSDCSQNDLTALAHAKRRITDTLKPVTYIRVTADQATGQISMCNDGNGIDVEVHPVSKLWIPEMIFAHLRTGTNYNKSEEKIVGGKNGLGAKLIFIWSTWGKIETVDHIRGLHYEQEFTGNLSTIGVPKITKVRASTKPYTKLTFLPDYARMGISGLDNDMIDLFKRRAYDVAGITDKKVAVWFNDVLIDVRTFTQYVDMYVPEDETGKKYKCLHEQNAESDRWEYAVCLSPFYKFTSVSFVNGICTHAGGKHVDYIADQIVTKIMAIIEQKRKIVVKPSFVKEQLMLFVRCDIVNPSFDSQSKNKLETPASKFGSVCVVTDKFIQKVATMVMDAACQRTEMRNDQQLKMVVDGTKTSKVHDIEQLTDAIYAGTAKSKLTTLIITEGNSAKAGVVSGMDQTLLKTIGIFAARGKPLNVRKQEINVKDANNNTFREIVNIMKSMGLKIGEVYDTWEKVWTNLRYGHLLLFTDQDKDGSHIKGLCINFIHYYWPSLFRLDGFIQCQHTPLIIASRGTAYKPGDPKNIEMYDLGEYEQWLQTRSPSEKWYCKYFKGLGTSSAVEFSRYMRNPKIVSFKYMGPSSDDKVDMWFNVKRVADRSRFLEFEYDPTRFIDMSKKEISYDEFYDHEMSHFSNYDNCRSIASAVDGLKPSFRKILFSAFKRNLVNEVKVAQFAGYVSEHSGYHHGEASLHSSIIHMGQTFTGSNNIPLLWPCGIFGSRIEAGKDAASPRYIFTHLSEITRSLFRKEDDPILNYLTDDNLPVEPDYYLPILPMILVNGTSGIGTGWSTDVPQYNVRDILHVIRARIGHDIAKSVEELVPSYDGFIGTVAKIPGSTKYMVKGVYTMTTPTTVVVTEIPVGVSYNAYKDMLNGKEKEVQIDRARLITLRKEVEKKRKEKVDEKDKVMKDLMKEFTTLSAKMEVVEATGLVVTNVVPQILEHSIRMTITFEKPLRPECMAGSSLTSCSVLEKYLELGTSLSISNMVLHNERGRIHRYRSPEEIIDAFVPVRLDAYRRRKEYQLSDMRKRLPIIENKARFIREVTNKTLVLFGLTGDETYELLRARKYYKHSEGQEEEEATTEGDEEKEGGKKTSRDYAYLLDMKMGSLIRENMTKLEAEYRKLATQIQELEQLTPEQLWASDLSDFEIQYERFLVLRNNLKGSAEPDVVATQPPPSHGAKKSSVRKAKV